LGITIPKKKSVAKSPYADKDHGRAVGIGGGNHLFIALGSPRLHDGGGSGLHGRDQTIGKGEKGI
jgi:hypothetical protein